MEEKVLEVMEEIAEGSSTYDGDDLLEAGILDSFLIMDLIAKLEETLQIRIGARQIIEENFQTKETIIEMVKTAQQ